jgi:hypothetical protein
LCPPAPSLYEPASQPTNQPTNHLSGPFRRSIFFDESAVSAAEAAPKPTKAPPKNGRRRQSVAERRTSIMAAVRRASVVLPQGQVFGKDPAAGGAPAAAGAGDEDGEDEDAKLTLMKRTLTIRGFDKVEDLLVVCREELGRAATATKPAVLPGVTYYGTDALFVQYSLYSPWEHILDLLRKLPEPQVGGCNHLPSLAHVRRSALSCVCARVCDNVVCRSRRSLRGRCSCVRVRTHLPSAAHPRGTRPGPGAAAGHHRRLGPVGVTSYAWHAF